MLAGTAVGQAEAGAAAAAVADVTGEGVAEGRLVEEAVAVGLTAKVEAGVPVV